ncbi:MAG: DUF2182 domain-containing protein, partial [Burkholderiales bacterium]
MPFDIPTGDGGGASASSPLPPPYATSARARARRDLALPLLVALVAVAWFVLFMWERSPYGRYLTHGELAHVGHGAGTETLLVQAALYVAGWTLMTAAMMLPTTLPLMYIFRRLTRVRQDSSQLMVLLIAGYVGVWLAFGVAAHVFDLGLHEAFHESAWLQHNAWVFGAGPLLVAGAFQFSKLKYRCLDKCRAPLSFVIEHWHGGDTRLQALRLGAHHGAFCVGCCWALMALLLAFGLMNLTWMAILTLVVLAERTLRCGPRLGRLVGV